MLGKNFILLREHFTKRSNWSLLELRLEIENHLNAFGISGISGTSATDGADAGALAILLAVTERTIGVSVADLAYDARETQVRLG